MSLEKYGVLKGSPVEFKTEGKKPHLQIRIRAKGEDYRIALNVQSTSIPPELKYLILKDFKHPFTDQLTKLEDGITLKDDNMSIGIDYIRENFFDYHGMKIAHHISADDNEVSDTIQLYLDKAMNNSEAKVYAFGQAWENKEGKDRYFPSIPDQGIHDIHMNQGNAGGWLKDNGIFQDGALFIHFPGVGAEDRWVAVFLAFQSQSFHTDDNTGNPLPDVDDSDEKKVVIVSSLINSKFGKSNISLLNRSDKEVSLEGWSIFGGHDNKKILFGVLEAGEFLKIELEENEFAFSEKGGIITLLNQDDIKMDGVSYTTPDYYRTGYTVCFRTE